MVKAGVGAVMGTVAKVAEAVEAEVTARVAGDWVAVEKVEEVVKVMEVAARERVVTVVVGTKS